MRELLNAACARCATSNGVFASRATSRTASAARARSTASVTASTGGESMRIQSKNRGSVQINSSMRRLATNSEELSPHLPAGMKVRFEICAPVFSPGLLAAASRCRISWSSAGAGQVFQRPACWEHPASCGA